MKTFVIIGGGISGLSAAHYLSKVVKPSVGKIILLEGSSRIGGWLESTKYEDGTVFDHGPRSIRSAGKVGINTLNLVEEVGLAGDVIPITRDHPAAKNRFIYAHGKLCPLPSNFAGILMRRDPFSRSFIRQCWNEPFKKAPEMEDDTIFNFFSRRFSPEVAQYTSDPMCRGIFAGDARKLSIKSCFKELFKYEQEYGSVVKGMFRAPKDKSKMSSTPGLVIRSREERWAIWSLSRGLEQLVEAMHKSMTSCDHVHIRTNTPCTQIQINDHNKVKVMCGDEEINCDHLFATCPSTNLATMFGNEHTELATKLNSVPSVHCAVVNLEYPADILPVMGFGHLIPSTEDTDVMGVVYESAIFPQHNKPGAPSTRLTVMMGGAWFEQLFGDPDVTSHSRYEQSAISAVSQQLGTVIEPSKVLVRVHKNCIPQYLLGHDKLVGGAEKYISDRQLPISLLGSSYRGVSVNDCIYNARTAVEHVVNT